MSSTATTAEATTLNDHASSATLTPPNTGITAKNEVLYAKQGPAGAGSLRLDALTIAGLTGTHTPHAGRAVASFFGTAAGAAAAAASPQSPAGSDDTLGSIQDSSIGDEVCMCVLAVLCAGCRGVFQDCCFFSKINLASRYRRSRVSSLEGSSMISVQYSSSTRHLLCCVYGCISKGSSHSSRAAIPMSMRGLEAYQSRRRAPYNTSVLLPPCLR